MVRLAVLASHEGTTLQALIDACAEQRLDAQLVAVISNNSNSGALRRANAAAIPTHHISGKTHDCEDSAVLQACQSAQADWVLLLGYMKKLGAQTLAAYKGRILNTHSSAAAKIWWSRLFRSSCARGGDRGGGNPEWCEHSYCRLRLRHGPNTRPGYRASCANRYPSAARGAG